MAWKLIEVDDYDEDALTNRELVFIGFLVDQNAKNVKDEKLKQVFQSIINKLDDDIKDAAKLM